MIMKTLKLLAVLFLLISISSCGDDDDDGETEDIQQLVEKFASPEVLQTLEDLGFVFRQSTDIPNDVIGTFVFNPNILSTTSIEDDGFDIGTEFPPLMISFSDIDNENRTFVFEASQGGITFNLISTFLTGDDSGFNAYAQVEFTNNNSETAIFILAFSGVITPEGITSGQNVFALLSASDEGPGSNFIAPGEGRLFIDSDGLVERVDGEDDNSILDNSNILYQQGLSSLISRRE